MRRHMAMMDEDTASLLITMGANIELARKRRRLPIDTVCERAGITAQTYRRLAKGDAGATLGVLVAVLHAMSLEQDMAMIAAPGRDEVGINLERVHGPQRVRATGGKHERLDTNF